MNRSIEKLACTLVAALLLLMTPAVAQTETTEPPETTPDAAPESANGQADAPADDAGDLEAAAKPPAPTNLVAVDVPWDNGQNIKLTWNTPADADDLRYRVEKKAAAATGAGAAAETDAADGDTEWKFVDLTDAGMTEYVVRDLDLETAYLFRVQSMTETGALSDPLTLDAPFSATREFFFGDRLYLLIITVVFCFAVIFWIYHARSGREIKVRQIAGLEAVDEAVGRATEMGRPCLFVPGIQDINEIQTIAGLTILSRVAKTAAEYDATVEVPTARSLVMTTARETVQAAYMAAGRPEAYNQDLIYYVTDEQFGYVAYLQGMMVREKPAACFYMGAFYAESLILAETGNGIGSIQVAGTAMPAQLPFFVAACDYTLIGEEFFAASAYLSGSPEELGSLKGQDVGKVIVAIVLMIGVLLFTAANMAGLSSALGTAFMSVVDWLKNSVLT